jgi:hypothetical protein
MASFLSDLFGGGAEKEAAAKDTAALQAYQGQALPALQTGYGTGTTAVNTAIGGYQPLTQLGATYSSAAPTMMAALGIGSPQDVANARNAFTASPGYQYTLDQALQSLQRARGGMASGNLDTDVMNYAHNLSNQDYQQWISNLMGAGAYGLNATAGAAAGKGQQYDALAQLAQQYATNQAGVYGNVAQGTIGANNMAAAGEAQGAKNLLGLGESIIGAVGSAFGGGGLGSLLGKFGGGGGGGGYGGASVGPTYASGGQGMMGGTPFSIY